MTPTYELWVSPNGSTEWVATGVAGTLKRCVAELDRFAKSRLWFKRIEPIPAGTATPKGTSCLPPRPVESPSLFV